MNDEKVIAGRYRLAERLGDGGMGVVWQGYDERLHRKVAVKQVRLPADLTAPQGQEMVRRTMREGRIAARLQHPQLITVYDVVEDGGQPYLIMEYLPSRTLAEYRAERGPLPYTEVAAIGAQAASGLAAAHAAGVVHRDVKPANVLVGHNGTVKISDFGISRVVADLTSTLTGTFAGTPAYLAPEVAKGEDATYASDVYSLGATLYATVEGMPPPGSEPNPMKLLYRVSTGEVPPPTNAGPLTDLLMSLLAIDPAARPTMCEASSALAAHAGDALAEQPTAVPSAAPLTVPPTAVAAETPAETPAEAPTTAMPPAAAPTAAVPPRPVPPPGRKPRQSRRKAVLLGVGLVVIALAAALATVLVNRDEEPPAAGSGSDPTSEQPQNRPQNQPQNQTSNDQTTTAPTTTTTTQQAPPPPTTTTAAPAPPPAAPNGTPTGAITSYYALMPGDLDTAWNRLSPNYQAAHPRPSFNGWWSRVRAVTAGEVTAIDSDSVEVTLVYSFTNGRRVRERHSYGLVNQGGQWLIDSSNVLSSGPA